MVESNKICWMCFISASNLSVGYLVNSQSVKASTELPQNTIADLSSRPTLRRISFFKLGFMSGFPARSIGGQYILFLSFMHEDHALVFFFFKKIKNDNKI